MVIASGGTGGGKEDVLDCVASFGESSLCADVGEETVCESAGVSDRGIASTTSCVDTGIVIGAVPTIGATLGERERRRLRGGLEGGIFSVSGIGTVDDAAAFCVNDEGGCLNLECDEKSAQ